MKKYYGYKYQVKGVTTLGFIPLTMDAPFSFGYYDFETKSLVLVSKDTKEELQIFQKMSEIGEKEVKVKDGQKRPLVERRMIKNNLTFILQGDDINWFLANQFENSTISSKIIDTSLEDYAKMQTEQNTEQSGIDNRNEQLLPQNEGSGLQGDITSGGEGETLSEGKTKSV